jgi:hypothetical protein
MVDQRTLEVFADEPEVLNWKDRVAAIHELFADCRPIRKKRKG